MNRSSLIPVATLAVTLPVIAVQYVQNSRLRDLGAAWQDAAGGNGRPVIAGSRSGPGGTAGGKQGPENAPEPRSASTTSYTSGSLKALLASPDPLVRLRSLFEFAESIPSSDLGEALAELRASAPDWDPEARVVAHLLLTRWGAEDPDAAFASLAKLDPKQASSDASAILAAFAAGDPHRALAWLDDPENELAQRPYMGHVLSGTIAKEWVRTDPDAALAWASTLPEDQRAGAYTGALRSLAGDDPERASELAMTLEPGKERSRVVGEIAEAWSRKSPIDALDWASSLEGDDRHNATRESLEAWTNSEPEKAAAHVSKISDDAERSRLLPAVAAGWSAQQPAAAAGWLGEMPESDGKTDAMGWVAWHWTNADPEAASTWLADQPPSPSRDRAITSLAKATFDSDPAAAVTWSAAITNERTRDEAVTRGLTEWMKRDPDAASAWVDGGE